MATYPGQVIGGAPALSIGAALARAFGAIRAAPATFVAVAAVLLGGPSLAFRLLAGSLLTPDRINELPRLWPWFVGGGLVWWIAYLVAQTLFFLLTAAAGERRRPGMGELLADTARVLPAVFVQSILMTLAIPLACLFFFVPGVLLWLLWAVAPPSLAIERSGLFGSFGRSARLTAGSRFHLVAIVFLVFAIYFVASSVLGVVSLMVTGFAGAAAAQAGPAFVAISVVSAVLQMVFAVVWSAIKAAVFLELRELKDGPAGDRLAGIFA